MLVFEILSINFSKLTNDVSEREIYNLDSMATEP